MALHYLTKCFGREEKGEGRVDNPYFRLAAPFLSSGGTEEKEFVSALRPTEYVFRSTSSITELVNRLSAARASDDDISDLSSARDLDI